MKKEAYAPKFNKNDCLISGSIVIQILDIIDESYYYRCKDFNYDK